MMQDISTTLKGRIGSVPTMKHIKGDTCVTTFRLAIPRWRFTVDARTGNASYVEDGAYWYTIETWDKLADNVVREGHVAVHEERGSFDAGAGPWQPE